MPIRVVAKPSHARRPHPETAMSGRLRHRAHCLSYKQLKVAMTDIQSSHCDDELRLAWNRIGMRATSRACRFRTTFAPYAIPTPFEVLGT